MPCCMKLEKSSRASNLFGLPVPAFPVFLCVVLCLLCCYVVVLLSILLLMVKLLLKYLIGNQGMFPIPALVKVIVAVSGRKKGARNREPFFSS